MRVSLAAAFGIPSWMAKHSDFFQGDRGHGSAPLSCLARLLRWEEHLLACDGPDSAGFASARRDAVDILAQAGCGRS